MTLISVLSQYNYQNTRYDIDKSEVIPGVFVSLLHVGYILYFLRKLWKKIFTRRRKKLYYMKLFADGADASNA